MSTAGASYVAGDAPATPSRVRITNCHVHTFTERHVPSDFVRFPLNKLLRVRWIRRAVLAVILRFDRGRRGRIARFARVLEVSEGSQQMILDKVRGFYPRDTRFVVLPMDMAFMGAGHVESSIDAQHDELASLAQTYEGIVIPFVASDPRRPGVVDSTIDRLENGFRGVKLYPPLGYHPFDPRLWPLYDYAAERAIPVLSHCSRPASIVYRGAIDDAMTTDPDTGAPLPADRNELLTAFTDPDAYLPLLKRWPTIKLCLAHFGGAGEWEKYLEDPWVSGDSPAKKSWLAKILDLLRDDAYPNVYTDISYTLFANDEYLYLLRVLLSDQIVASRVLFGSDFYVVESAELEERRRSVRLRAILGEPLFRLIAEQNPQAFLA